MNPHELNYLMTNAHKIAQACGVITLDARITLVAENAISLRAIDGKSIYNIDIELNRQEDELQVKRLSQREFDSMEARDKWLADRGALDIATELNYNDSNFYWRYINYDGALREVKS